MQAMTYKGEYTKEIIFPLGGMGTGSIGMSGAGRLVDWEIANQPNKGSVNGYSHLSVKAVNADGRLLDARVLNGDLAGDYMGQYCQAQYGQYKGYGFGPLAETMAGFPHFSTCVFEARFPFAHLRFTDDAFPGEVTLHAFNPFIPLDADDSSLPAAFFEVTFTNPTAEAIDYTAGFSVGSLFSKETYNTLHQEDGYTSLAWTQCAYAPDDPRYGEVVLATNAARTHAQTHWFRGTWFDAPTVYWEQFARAAPLPARTYDTAGCGDMGTLCASTRVEAGMQKTLRFTLCWYYPVQINRWNPSPDGHNTWKNHYATRFDGAAAVAHDALARWDDLAARTRAFSDALFASTLPLEVLDAVSANLAVLKSPTVLRLEDGSLYGWEGVNEHAGSCEGSCTHVWAYQYAVPFLFPALARSMRELEYHSNLWENGGMSFRLQLPVGRAHAGDTPCVDGQMASVLGVYREWKLCGDNDWLRMLWPSVRASIAFTWSPTNAFRWDADKDGILEGRQHHTLDVELFGPSSWLQGLYLAALKAGAAMADALEDTETAACYRALYANGRAFTDTQLFNGAYYEQRIDLCDRTVLAPYPAAEAFYWNDEAGQIKYQIGHGCAIDQVNAQWHANLLGLGALYDHTQLLKALQSIYTYNFQPSMRDSFNPCRVFSLNDEGGTVICAYPEGVEKPVVPIPYCQETMTGFEYQAACLMISEGMVQQGLTILRAIRDRYDGRKRNPWNEIECGNNYARSMASYSLLATYTGFTFDLPRGIIGFHPILPADGRFQGVWSVDSGWGIVTEDAHGMTIRILAGKLTIAGLALPCLDAACVQLDGQDTPIRREAALLLFPARQHVLREIRILRAPSEENKGS